MITGRELEVVDVAIERAHGFLSTLLPNGVLVEGTARHLVAMLHGLIFWDLMQSHGRQPLAHGASVVIGDRRFMVTGHKGSGKTTLMLHLLAAGHRVEGDEHLVLQQDSVIARPRTLRVKPGSFRIVENLPAGIATTPSFEQWDGSVIHAVSPALFGSPWSIREGRLDGMIFIQPNHGGRSIASKLSTDDAFTRLMQSVYLAGNSALMGTVQLRRLASERPAYLLRLGDLSGAEFHLRRLAAY